MSSLRATWITAIVTAGVVLAEYLAVADSPLFSESYFHHAATAKFDGLLLVLALARHGWR